MLRSLATATLLLLTLASANAADKPAHGKVHGTWKRDVGGDTSLTFHFKHDTLRVELKRPEGNINLEADYAVNGKGLLLGLVTKGEGEGINVGDFFAFTVSVNGDTMTISDLRGKSGEEAKKLVEGEYKKVEKPGK